jgi:hypothetical protein
MRRVAPPFAYSDDLTMMVSCLRLRSAASPSRNGFKPHMRVFGESPRGPADQSARGFGSVSRIARRPACAEAPIAMSGWRPEAGRRAIAVARIGSTIGSTASGLLAHRASISCAHPLRRVRGLVGRASGGARNFNDMLDLSVSVYGRVALGR